MSRGLAQRMKKSRISQSIALVLPSVLLVAFLWLPFGFSLTGLIEEWDVLGYFTRSGVFPVIGPGTPLAAHALRPLTVLPQALAYMLDPNSFDGWHLLLMSALVLKGLASTLVVRSITPSARWSLLFGLLVLVYPADTMQLAFRSLHINWSLSLILLASALLLAAQDSSRKSATMIFSVTAAASLLTSVLMYEVAFALVPLPVLVLIVRGGIRATWSGFRARPLPLLIWTAACGLCVAYVIVVSIAGTESYQHSVTEGRSPLAILQANLPRLFTIGVLRALAGGWFDAWGMFRSAFAGHVYVLVAALACWASIRILPVTQIAAHFKHPPRPNQSAGLAARTAAAGIVLLILGYVPYLFSNAHLLISQRTYLFASPGAALVLLALLLAIAHASKRVAEAMCIVLLVLGVSAQLLQFHHYIWISEAQRGVLKHIVENFDGNMDGKTLLILDYSGRLSHTWLLRDNLNLALSYLYGKPVDDVEICLMPSHGWQRLDGLGRMGKCSEGPQAWTLRPAPPPAGTAVAGPAALRPDRVLDKRNLLTVQIEQDGSVTQAAELDAYRARLRSGDLPVARRYSAILARQDWPLTFDLFASPAPGATYRWDFGTWWSLERPTRGAGWREAEWQVGAFHHDATAWKTQETASLLFDLAPAQERYVLQGVFTALVSDAIRASVRIRINKVAVDLRWITVGAFEADIAQGILRQGVNTIEFESAIDPNYHNLSVQLSEFEVRPAAAPAASNH